jgi:hypothetical protein
MNLRFPTPSLSEIKTYGWLAVVLAGLHVSNGLKTKTISAGGFVAAPCDGILCGPLGAQSRASLSLTPLAKPRFVRSPAMPSSGGLTPPPQCFQGVELG